MSWDFERVAGEYGTTEGPVWDGSGVVFTDMPGAEIRRYDAETGDCEVRYEDTNSANGLKMADDGTLYACEMGGRRLVRYEDGEPVPIVEAYRGRRLNSPNDLAFDTEGRIWFTDPHYGSDWEADDKVLELHHRSIYRVDPDDPDTLTRMTTDTTNPNGLLVSPDDEYLYVAQSDYEGARELRAYPIEGDSVGPAEVLHTFHPHRGIDGMCLDEDGNIVATAGSDDGGPGPMIYVFAPSGRVLGTHPTPDPRPTNCCFGGDDLSDLYVTGFHGCLYRAETDRTGLLGAPSG